ncbi:hypothetical protein SAMN05443574_105294 [Haloarcula vallismortis]|uniref:DUF2188 domain-containing protein n=2 Tax=Haloarcula vallismortis TaxID=28442 RepID=M0JFS7_HALVA|nr:DUF2188 domain-containing protein [Haloarcula vallismortis]EMA06864.1 hypothetical protein C437_12188 [Haloarcula vallismortis ATCC 29715]SDW67566.1 hypothetical protein SAMN05443574_105294 [Haloarcula vallismortis]
MTEYHVTYSDEDREWKVKKAGAERASRTADNKQPAIEKARTLAKSNRPSTVYVHYKKPGQDLKPVQNEFSYAARQR